MVSIKTIAAACNVSIATVSKALHDHNDVSEATKQKIRETAKSLGYLPNSQARALKTHRTFNLGVLFVDKAESGLTNSYFASLLESFKVEAERLGYDITFISKNIDTLHMSYYEHCKYRNVDGVVIACVDYGDPDVQELLNSGLPVVAVDYEAPGKLSVLSDNENGMKQLMEYILACGHTKIAYIYGETSKVSAARLASYKEVLSSAGIAPRSEYLVEGRFHDFVSAQENAKRLLEMPDPPTCIVAPDDFSAVGVMNAAESMGLSIPKDVSLAGYDGIFLLQALKPRLTTIRQDTKSIGREAATLLIRQITKQEDSPEPTIVQGELLKGETVCIVKK